MNYPRSYRTYSVVVAFAAATFLSACGGGGSGDGGGVSNSPAALTGIFVDGLVSGINFRTPTGSGTTNQAGEFFYNPGEQITFYIGAVELPPVTANAVITPLEIAQTTDINNQVVSNILVLLQSLDADGNPANGINIPATASAVATTSVDFNVSPTAFAANPTVANLVAKSGSTNKVVVSVSVAQAHFVDTMHGSNGATKINVAPVANAGTAQSVVVGATVTVTGAASSDANGDQLTYAWTLTSEPAGSSASLASLTSATSSFAADVAGTYVASLVVNDGSLSSNTVTVNVAAAVANVAPVANAGTAQSVVTATLVTLNGAASSDANGDQLTYAWTLTSKPTGSSASLTNPTSATPSFTADVAGTYVASLVVNDGRLNSNTATVSVTAAVANAAPVANAGAAQNCVAGTVVTLDGSASSDANGDSLSYAWTLTGKPAGSAAILSSSTSAKPTFTADVVGTYVVSLIVNDGSVNSSPVAVSIAATAPVPPVATPRFSVISLDAQNAGLVLSADFDGDGLVDIVAMSNGGVGLEGPQSYVYRQTTDGSFIRSPLEAGFFYPAIASDLNRDGISDLIVGTVDGSCRYLVRLGTANLQFSNNGGFSIGNCGNPELWVGDFNGDSIMDVVALSQYQSIAIGDGKGQFTASQPTMPFQYQGTTVAIGDVDGDGIQDMVAINPQYGNSQFLLSLALGAGSGNYNNIKNFIHPQDHGWSSQPRAKLVDVNNDGLKDILYFPGGTGFLQLVATGPGVFDAQPTWVEMASWISQVEVTDVNGDGNVDLVAASSDGLMLLLGDGKGGWSAPIFPLGKSATYSGGVAVRDVNRDNRPDIIFGAGKTVVLLLQNP